LYKYQGQERQDELGLNWDSFKWRNYDSAIGRFISIAPLTEEYAYNSPYAFQENKMGMGRELEGLELAPSNPTASFGGWISSKYDSAVSSVQTATSNIVKSVSIGKTTDRRGSGGSGGSANSGVAFSDGGNNQNPSELPKGGRDVPWVDFGGYLEAMTTIAAFELNVNFAPVGKGTNGGRSTTENKADDIINTTDFGVSAGKSVKSAKEEANKEKSNSSSSLETEYVKTDFNPKTGNETWTRRDYYEERQKEQKK